MKERKGRSRSLARGSANWVRCARIVVRGSLSGRKPNIAAVYEKRDASPLCERREKDASLFSSNGDSA